MTGIAKRIHALADGRDLIYFDDAGPTLPPDRAPDAREIDARQQAPARSHRDSARLHLRLTFRADGQRPL